MIKLLCKNRQIFRTDNQWVVEYSRNVDPINTTFDEEWDGLNISITFRNGEIGPNTWDYIDGMSIPAQFLETGKIHVSFTGRKLINGEDVVVLKTGEMQYPILCHKAGDVVSMPPVDVPPNIWDQAIAKADEALNKANEALDLANQIRLDVDEMMKRLVPEGGTEGQVLGKLSDKDNDIGWVNQTGSGGASKWEDLENKPFDEINPAEMEVIGSAPNRQLGVKVIDQSKVAGLNDKLNNIENELSNKQPSGNYATREELSQGLDGKQDAGDYATNAQLIEGLNTKQDKGNYSTKEELESGLKGKQDAGDYATNSQLSAGLNAKQDKGNYATKEELETGLGNKQDKGDYATKAEIPDKLPNPSAITFTGKVSATYDGSAPVEINIPEGGAPGTLKHNELTEESRALPDQHPMSAITGLNDALAGKQSAGDYATKTELTNGLSGKQDAGDYATNTDLAEKQNKTKIVTVTMTTETEGTSDVPDSQILKWIREGDAVKALVFYNGKLVMELNDYGQDTFGFYFKKENVEENTINVHYVYIYGVQVKTRIEYFSPYADTVVSEIPPELPSSTVPNVQAVLNALSTDKLSKTGHTPNKNLVTDTSGNVSEADFEKPYVIVPSEQEVPYDEDHIVYREEDATGGGADISLGMTGASVGQIAEILEIDENGTPTKWKPIDKPKPVYPEIIMVEPTAELQPNMFYVWPEMATLDITLAPELPDVVSEYCGEFISGASPTVFSVPGDIKWITPLKVEASKKYQFSIINGIGVIGGA